MGLAAGHAFQVDQACTRTDRYVQAVNLFLQDVLDGAAERILAAAGWASHKGDVLGLSWHAGQAEHACCGERKGGTGKQFSHKVSSSVGSEDTVN